MSIACPKCKTPTTVFNFEADLNFDRCETCLGMWLDKGELARTTSSDHDFPDPIQAKSGPKTDLSCPKCTHGLHEVAFGKSSVIVEVCGGCEGLWLDSRELVKVQEVLRRHRIEERKKRFQTS